MSEFQLVSDFQPQGDQPQAIAQLIAGLQAGYVHQTLLGATGTGKTYVMAQLVAQWQRPTLVIAHNKTLAAQLYSEFKEFLPHNAVEYFVSYYDYYQPEAYIPRTDTYIEKDASINDEIDRLRLSATQSLLSRKDVLIVASVSCIYGLGSPEDYGKVVIELNKGELRKRDKILRHLVDIYYTRNDVSFTRGTFRVHGDTLDIFPAYGEFGYRVEFWGDEVERIVDIDPLTGELLLELGDQLAADAPLVAAQRPKKGLLFNLAVYGPGGERRRPHRGAAVDRQTLYVCHSSTLLLVPSVSPTIAAQARPG